MKEHKREVSVRLARTQHEFPRMQLVEFQRPKKYERMREIELWLRGNVLGGEDEGTGKCSNL